MNLIAGPIVVWIAALLTYCPLTDAGLAFNNASTTAFKLSTNLFASNETLPNDNPMFPSLSTRYSILPFLISVIKIHLSVNQIIHLWHYFCNFANEIKQLDN